MKNMRQFNNARTISSLIHEQAMAMINNPPAYNTKAQQKARIENQLLKKVLESAMLEPAIRNLNSNITSAPSFYLFQANIKSLQSSTENLVTYFYDEFYNTSPENIENAKHIIGKLSHEAKSGVFPESISSLLSDNGEGFANFAMVVDALEQALTRTEKNTSNSTVKIAEQIRNLSNSVELLEKQGYTIAASVLKDFYNEKSENFLFNISQAAVDEALKSSSSTGTIQNPSDTAILRSYQEIQEKVQKDAAIELQAKQYAEAQYAAELAAKQELAAQKAAAEKYKQESKAQLDEMLAQNPDYLGTAECYEFEYSLAQNGLQLHTYKDGSYEIDEFKSEEEKQSFISEYLKWLNEDEDIADDDQGEDIADGSTDNKQNNNSAKLDNQDEDSGDADVNQFKPDIAGSANPMIAEGDIEADSMIAEEIVAINEQNQEIIESDLKNDKAIDEPPIVSEVAGDVFNNIKNEDINVNMIKALPDALETGAVHEAANVLNHGDITEQTVPAPIEQKTFWQSVAQTTKSCISYFSNMWSSAIDKVSTFIVGDFDATSVYEDYNNDIKVAGNDSDHLSDLDQ